MGTSLWPFQEITTPLANRSKTHTFSTRQQISSILLNDKPPLPWAETRTRGPSLFTQSPQ
jgi:hypothetical protein